MPLRILQKILLLLVFLLVNTSSCKKDEEYVPIYHVNFKIFIDQPQYANLHAPGNSMILNNNVIGENNTPHGIIVYRLSMDEFKAYERTCTYEPEKGCLVQIDSSGITATCPCCKSEYLLIDGYPTDGKAELPLWEYRTIFNGQELFVYN